MIVNKNDLTKLARVLVTYLGYMSIAFGLALPAYGDSGKTGPDQCAVGDEPVAITGMSMDDVGDGDPSSFAAGCNARAETDGSIAIGEGALVKEYEVTTPGDDGKATHNYDPDGGVGGLAARKVVVQDGGIYEFGADGALIGQIGEEMFEDANDAYTLTKRTEEDDADAIEIEGAYGIAIGTEANVRGRESIAIGARASAVRIDRTAGAEGTATHNYDPDGGVGGLAARKVVVRDGRIYEFGADGALIGRIGEEVFEDANDAYTLTKRTADDEDDETEEKEVILAVAIGADSSVTGNSGVALGAGAMAGTNSVSLGQGVTAGVNQIRIGGTGTANVEIGGHNLGSMSSTINSMGGTVRNNSDGIMTNSAGIATNSAGIAMSIAFAHLPSVSAGDKGSWGIGAGSFAGKTALAVGISYRVQTNGVIKAGVSSSGGETSFGVGFGKGF